jgi:CheY-like chemotaxis protein
VQPALTILHIEDDPATRLLVQELLADGSAALGERSEIRWLEASSFDEAVTEHGADHADAVLLDNRLGALDGVDLIGRVRLNWNCPVWLLTGLPTEELLDRSSRLGASGLIGKDQMLENPKRVLSLLIESLARRSKS